MSIPAEKLPLDLLLISEYAKLGLYSAGAIKKKIERGQWKEGFEYHKAPDGHIFISISGVEAWVRGRNTPALKLTERKSGSTSGLMASCTERL